MMKIFSSQAVVGDRKQGRLSPLPAALIAALLLSGGGWQEGLALTEILSNDTYTVECEVVSGGTGTMTGVLAVSDEGNVPGGIRIIVGQPFVSTGTLTGSNTEVNLGYWSRLLRVPGTPIVNATYDIFPDHVDLNWRYDPNDPPGTGNHKIYRNYQTNPNPVRTVYAGTYAWTDDGLPAGEQYEYRVQGSNKIKYPNTYQPLADAGVAFGKTSTNGAISGFVKTSLQSPIPDVRIRVYNQTMTAPAWGHSVFLSGDSEYVSIPDAEAFEFLDQTVHDSTTLELWFRPDNSGSQTLVSKGTQWELKLATDTYTYVVFTRDGTVVLSSDYGSQHLDQHIAVQEWNHLALVRRGDVLRLYINGDLATVNGGSTSATAATLAGDGSPLLLGCSDNAQNCFRGNLDELRIWDVARDSMFMEPYSDLNGNGSFDAGEYYTDVNNDGSWGASDSTVIKRDFTRLISYREQGLVVTPHLSGYYNMDLGTGTSILNSVDMDLNGTLTGDPNQDYWSSSQSPVYPTGFTDRDGFFQIQNLNFGDGTTFRAVPYKPYHEFNPLFKQFSLNAADPTNDEVNFQVTNMISVSGYVTYDTEGTGGPVCGVRQVEIWIDGEYRGHRTDVDGYYLIEVEPGRTLTLSAHRPGWEVFDWNPQTKTFFNVISPQSQNFVDLKKRTLRGTVTGGACEYPLGPAGVARVALTSSCFTDTMAVYAGGEYVFANLPIMSYGIKVLMNLNSGVNNVIAMDTWFLNHAAVLNMSAAYSLMDSAWVTEEDTVDFNWRAPLEFEVTGFPVNSHTNDYVYSQNDRDTLDIFVFESYYGGDCPLDTGEIHIKDWISDRYVDNDPQSDSIFVSFGTGGCVSCQVPQYRYALLPGLPNLVAPHTKNIEVQVSDTAGVREVSQIYAAVVLGHYPQTVDYATTAPEIPFLILRRPPGDGSMASFSQTSQSTLGFSMSLASVETHETTIETKLGVETTILTAPFGVGTAIDVDAEYSLEMGFGLEAGISSSTTLQFTTTTTTEYTTATAVELMGPRGTVFVGGALNLLYGQTDVLELAVVDSANNSWGYVVDSQPLFIPDGFATTFIYTRGYIEDYLIPELQFLAQDSADLLQDVTRWQNILAYEDSLRWATAVENNYSLSGGGQAMTITHSQETAGALTIEEYIQVNSSFAQSMGLEVAGSGVGMNVRSGVSFRLGASQTLGLMNASTTSYTLMDDDTGDDYSIDVGTDPVYSTPVFNVIAGNSSCPYEEWTNAAGEVVTTPRDEPGMSWITPSLAVEVLPGDPAEFWIRLQNQADNSDPRTYELCYLTASNPHGAIIRINGEDADESNPIQYTLPQYGQDSALITVMRPPGSNVYEFDNLYIKFAPPCETNYAGVTQGFTTTFGVHYARPCTDAEIYQPDDNWVLNQSYHDSMTIIVQGYDLNQSYFEELLVQYQQVGDNAWTAVDTLDADTLRYYNLTVGQLIWDVSEGVPDGIYDLRLMSVCLGGVLTNVMNPLRGVIDRQSPQVLGAPEPVDGVLNMNDEIAVNFTEAINPESVNPVNVHLLDNTTDNVITDFQLSVSPQRLVLTPLVQNYFIENHTLTASFHGYKDMYGNTGDTISWTFTVNRNPVSWNVPATTVIAIIGEPNNFNINLNNIGANAEAFELQDLPDWLTATPMLGEINPGGSFAIHFHISENLNVGEFAQVLYANTSKGREPLQVNVISMCPYPEWEFEPSDFLYTMNATARLFVKGTKSEDTYDRLGAFVNGECRGYVNLEYLAPLEEYYAFLTIYSNQFSGEVVNFHIWDRTACAEYWEVDTSLVFMNDSYAGTPAVPLDLNANGAIAQDIDMASGFTWFSLNLNSDLAADVDSVLHGFQAAAGDRIIGQTQYVQYSETEGTWVGSPDWTGFELGRMYISDFDSANALNYVGFSVGADTIPLHLSAGWNWIGYLPNQNMPANTALFSLSSTLDDLIKDQVSFAQFLPGYGWIGSLQWMYPGNGYKLLSAAADTLTYPSGLLLTPPVLARVQDSDLPPAPWVVNPHPFRHNMTITALIDSDTLGVNHPADAVAAVVGDQIRGLARPQAVPGLDAYRIFLMVYGNPGEIVSFRIWDARTDITYRGNEEAAFDPDAVVGSLNDPFLLTKAALQIGDKGYIPEVYSLSQNFPNPFNPLTRLGFGIPEDAHVNIRIYNMLGQHVRTLVNRDLKAGYRYLIWNGTNDQGLSVTSGVYLVVMESNSFREVRKMVVLK